MSFYNDKMCRFMTTTTSLSFPVNAIFTVSILHLSKFDILMIFKENISYFFWGLFDWFFMFCSEVLALFQQSNLKQECFSNFIQLHLIRIMKRNQFGSFVLRDFN